MKREKELIKNTFILLIGTLLPKFASFITLPIYTKYLTKTEYGIYDLIFTIISLIVPLVTLQLQSAVFRKLINNNDEIEKKKIISTSQIFTYIMAIIFSIILFFVFSSVNIFSRLIIILFMILEIFIQMGLQTARGLGKNKVYSTTSIINSFLNVILVIPILIKFKLGLLGLICSLTMSLFLAYLYLIIKTKFYKFYNVKFFDLSTLKELLKYSIPMIPNSISWWIVNASDRLLITFFLGITQNAIYAAASKIPSLYSLFYNTFNMAWQESATKYKNTKDVENYYSNTFNILFMFLTSGMLLLIAITPILFKILINSTYEKSYYQIPILYISLYLLSFSNYLGGIYVALKKTTNLAKSVIIGAVINVIINFIAIKKFGLYAASISTVISYFIVLIYRIIDIKKYYKITYNFKNIGISILFIIFSLTLYYFKGILFTLTNIIFSIFIFIVFNKNLLYKMLKNLKIKTLRKELIK